MFFVEYFPLLDSILLSEKWSAYFSLKKRYFHGFPGCYVHTIVSNGPGRLVIHKDPKDNNSFLSHKGKSFSKTIYWHRVHTIVLNDDSKSVGDP